MARHHVAEAGPADGRPMVFTHGYGCDQSVWSLITPAFADRHRVVTYDHLGSGRSDRRAWSPDRYAGLEPYGRDLIEICEVLELEGTIVVGHSVGAMIGALATVERPDLVDRLVMIAPSPRYIDDDGYRGGFSREEIVDLLQAIDVNHFRWSMAMAPVIMGNDDRPELAAALAESFVSVDPEVASHFARTTFLSDHRQALPRIAVPTLVMQCRNDVIAPLEVGDHMHERIPDSRLVVMDAEGHCPHLSAPSETIAYLEGFIAAT